MKSGNLAKGQALVVLSLGDGAGGWQSAPRLPSRAAGIFSSTVAAHLREIENKFDPTAHPARIGRPLPRSNGGRAQWVCAPLVVSQTPWLWPSVDNCA